MTNHPGDYHSFLHLAQLREDHLERKSKQRDKSKPDHRASKKKGRGRKW